MLKIAPYFRVPFFFSLSDLAFLSLSLSLSPMINSLSLSLFSSQAESVSIEQDGANEPFGVPSLVSQAARFILTRGLKHEGIFRVSPELQKVQDVKRQLGRKALDELTEDPHVAAHLLKDYLRKLPSPLFPQAANSSLISAAKSHDFADKMKKYADVISSLPAPSIRTLVILACVSRRVVDHSSDNKMSFQAMGVVLGPCVMRLDPMQMLEMWDSRVAEEVFGNFGSVFTGDISVLADLLQERAFVFSVGPPLTAKVQFLGGGGPSSGGSVDMQVNIAFVGEDNLGKMELFWACATKKPVEERLVKAMRGKLALPLEDVAMLDSGNTVGVQINYVFSWMPADPPPPGKMSRPVSPGPPVMPLPPAPSRPPRPKSTRHDDSSAVTDPRGVSRAGCTVCPCPSYRIVATPPSACIYCSHGVGSHANGGHCGECECQLYEGEVGVKKYVCACGHYPPHHKPSLPPSLPAPAPAGVGVASHVLRLGTFDLPPAPSFQPPSLPPPILSPPSSTTPHSHLPLPTPPSVTPPHSIPPSSAPPAIPSNVTPASSPQQDYAAILKRSNVVVLCYSVASRDSFEKVKGRWIPALLEVDLQAPVLLVGLEREKREEGVPDLVSEKEGLEVSNAFPFIYGYTEVSTSQYKGFRTLANIGLAAVLQDLQAKKLRAREQKVPSAAASAMMGQAAAAMAHSPQPSTISPHASALPGKKDPNKECRVM